MFTRGAGCDCLGLLRGVWREVIGPEPEVGARLYPRLVRAAGRGAALGGGAAPPRGDVADEARPGDVLLFRMRAGAVAKHLGLQAETGPGASFIHAYSGHGVVESALTPPWARRIVARFAFPERT